MFFELFLYGFYLVFGVSFILHIVLKLSSVILFQLVLGVFNLLSYTIEIRTYLRHNSSLMGKILQILLLEFIKLLKTFIKHVSEPFLKLLVRIKVISSDNEQLLWKVYSFTLWIQRFICSKAFLQVFDFRSTSWFPLWLFLRFFLRYFFFKYHWFIDFNSSWWNNFGRSSMNRYLWSSLGSICWWWMLFCFC